MDRYRLPTTSIGSTKLIERKIPNVKDKYSKEKKFFFFKVLSLHFVAVKLAMRMPRTVAVPLTQHIKVNNFPMRPKTLAFIGRFRRQRRRAMENEQNLRQ